VPSTIRPSSGRPKDPGPGQGPPGRTAPRRAQGTLGSGTEILLVKTSLNHRMTRALLSCGNTFLLAQRRFLRSVARPTPCDRDELFAGLRQLLL
jgi:hypothetical protein